MKLNKTSIYSKMKITWILFSLNMLKLNVIFVIYLREFLV